MKVCLEILFEQIKKFKSNYYTLLGEILNIQGFSNSVILAKNRLIDKTKAKKLNEKVNFLYNEISSIKKEIDNL